MGAYEFTNPGGGSSFGIFSGSDQKAGTLLPFFKPLAVYAVDANGSPVSGVEVTFTAPGSGPSGTFADTGTPATTISTNASGQAIAPNFTANSQSGSYTVNATVTGLPGSVNFHLVNESWFVTPTGSDANVCTSSDAPCLTINGAIAKAEQGDTIKVAIGTYTGTSSIVDLNKSVTISGGWNSGFASQIGLSTIDGGDLYYGVNIHDVGQANISGFVIKKSTVGLANIIAEVSVDRSAIIGNSRAVDNLGGNITITNSTISGNQERTYGVDTIRNSSGKIKFIQSTIANNSASIQVINSFQGGALIEVENSILSWSDATKCDANLISNGHNIFRASPPCYPSSITIQRLDTTDKVGVDPKLLPLTYSGVHPLLSDSPAIDQADFASCPAFDQRGRGSSPGAGCDIGAFEYQGVGSVPAYILDYEGIVHNLSIGNEIQFKALVLDDDSDPVPGVSVTFTAPASGASGVFRNTGTNEFAAVTDVNGVVISPTFKANSTMGRYAVIASVDGATSPANIQVNNTSQPIRTYTAFNYSSLPGSLQCDETRPGCTAGYDIHADYAHLYAMGTSPLLRG